jgi:hypothetical protein
VLIVGSPGKVVRELSDEDVAACKNRPSIMSTTPAATATRFHRCKRQRGAAAPRFNWIETA